MKITEKLIKSSCSPTIYKRGTEYFNEGRVHLKKYEETHISAAVDDVNIYNVDVEFNETRITKSFCTCPYYQTMKSPCKHIVSVMLRAKAQQSEGGDYSDENDNVARALCNAFALYGLEKTPMRLGFNLYINKVPQKGVTYGMSFTLDGKEIDGAENFIDCYIKGREFRMSSTLVYSPSVSLLHTSHSKVMDIIAESYSNRTVGSNMYTKSVSQTTFSSKTAARLFSYIEEADISIILDGVKCFDIQIREENPDILVDIEATDEDISLSVSDIGLSLTEDGEWFLYENIIYHTDKVWREYFMPIYFALSEKNRTQITFKGNNRILFAKHVLPSVSKKQGVVMTGIDELVVNEAPRFQIYFDADKRQIRAVVIAYYGNIPIRLKNDENNGDKIIIRDKSAEDEVLSEFQGFDYGDFTFTTDDDEGIYKFLKQSIPRLRKIAELNYSKSFEKILYPDNVKITTTVGYNEEYDFLEADFNTNLSYDELIRILTDIKLKKSYYRFDDGTFLDFSNDEQIENLYRLINLDFTDDEIRIGRKHIDKYYTLYLDSLSGIKRQESFKMLIDRIKSMRVDTGELNSVLRGYQKVGINWLNQLSNLGLGGILADDMGLGKTLQVLAFIHSIKTKTPTLIVTPSALMYNWLNEIIRFIPDATTKIIDGPKEERKKSLDNLEGYEFVITSYPLIRRDIDCYSGKEFEYLFIDEAQHIKNSNTMNAHAIKMIKAKHRFAITGTPIENSLSELWSIFDFIMPGYLYDKHTFREEYEYPIMREGDAVLAKRLREKIKPFIMRRMKNEVLYELPEKIEETIYADLTDKQKKMYAAFLAVAKDETLSILSGNGRGRMRILTLLMRLRQICCHPSLFDSAYNRDSGKLNLLFELVENALGGGHRILVFSQFTSMLKIIGEEMDKRDISYFYLDGKVKSYERADMADRFNNGEKQVFLISLKADSEPTTVLTVIVKDNVSISKQVKDTVIHFDPWWNPAVMDQASDRAYRIGQTRAVHVIKLASRGTIEEKILKLQSEKRHLADDIISENSKTLKNLTNDEIMALFD